MRRNSSKGCEDSTSRKGTSSVSKAGRGSERGGQVAVQVKQGKAVRQCRKGKENSADRNSAVVCYTRA